MRDDSVWKALHCEHKAVLLFRRGGHGGKTGVVYVTHGLDVSVCLWERESVGVRVCGCVGVWVYECVAARGWAVWVRVAVCRYGMATCGRVEAV